MSGALAGAKLKHLNLSDNALGEKGVRAAADSFIGQVGPLIGRQRDGEGRGGAAGGGGGVPAERISGLGEERARGCRFVHGLGVRRVGAALVGWGRRQAVH